MTASENRKTPPKERRTDGRRLHLMNVDEERGSAGEQPPSAVGRSLRRARRDKGLSLEQAAQALRIKREHLEALETSRHEDLPGATYAIGFLRSYAAFLELDARAVVAQFKEEERVRADPTRLVFPEPVGQVRRPGWRVALIGVLLAGALYGGWLYIDSRPPQEPQVPEPPQRLSELLGRTAGPAAAADSKAAAPSTETSAPAGEAAAANEGGAAPASPPLTQMEPTRAEVAPLAPTGDTASGEGAQAEPAAASGSAESGEQAAAQDADAAAEPDSEAVAGEAGASPGTTSQAEPPLPAHQPDHVEQTAEATATGTPAAADGGVAAPAAETETASPPLPANNPDTATDTATADSDAGSQEAALPPPAPAPAATAASSEADSQAVTGYRPQVYGAGNRGARIVLHALADSWVQIQGPDNQLLLTRILHAGDSYRAPDRPGLVLMTGNAGAIEVQVDGKRLGTLGPEGQVRRDVALNVDAMRTLMRGGR